MDDYSWPRIGEFLNRTAELEALNRWWDSSERTPLNLYGRRRVGKSWLLRRFAHGKQAIVLTADRVAEGAQLKRFAERLAPAVGVIPAIPDVRSLFQMLHRLASSERRLVVIDEFPWLLPDHSAERTRMLSEIQAVMEEESDSSRLKLILCGSAIRQMEALQEERNPLHGRLLPKEIRPLGTDEARLFLPEVGPDELLTRFAISGGQPKYLHALSQGDLQAAVCEQILTPDAPLWNEGRSIVSQELPDSGLYFSLLEVLADGDKELGEVASKIPGVDAKTANKYLSTLAELRLATRSRPVGAPPTQKKGHWMLSDPFLRFWFRFVFPFQGDLEGGLDPLDLYTKRVEPDLAHHTSPIFEDECRRHTRRAFGGDALQVGRWWGKSVHALRRDGTRSTEEIDVVGLDRHKVTVVGEAKWTRKPMDLGVLDDLVRYKIPALRQDGKTISRDLRTVLYSRSGFAPRLIARAAEHEDLTLVTLSDVVSVSPRR